MLSRVSGSCGKPEEWDERGRGMWVLWDSQKNETNEVGVCGSCGTARRMGQVK